MDGLGKLTNKSSEYEGFFKDGKKCGKGVLRLHGGERYNGETYDGNWLANYR